MGSLHFIHSEMSRHWKFLSREMTQSDLPFGKKITLTAKNGNSSFHIVAQLKDSPGTHRAILDAFIDTGGCCFTETEIVL